MKNNTLIIFFALSIGLFISCVDKDKRKGKTKIESIDYNQKNDTNGESSEISKDDKIEQKRLDSIRQVKEHGHTH